MRELRLLILFSPSIILGCFSRGKKEERALLISGGFVDYKYSEDGSPGIKYEKEKFVEIWSTKTGKSCSLPPLPYLIYGQSHDADWICGGWTGDWSSDSRKSCYVWTDGKWQKKVILVRDRFGHVSWRTEAGLMLLGGEGKQSKQSSEIIKDGVSQLSFPLKYRVVFSCAINDEMGGVLITGGFDGKTAVERVSLYNQNGFQSDLPGMENARGGHSCASFLNKDQEKSYLVVGGRGVGSRQSSTLSSAEMWTTGALSWTQAADLPGRVFGAAAVHLDGFVYLTGGEAYQEDAEDTPRADVLMYHHIDRVWRRVGNMSSTRYYHAVTTAPLSHYSQYCP